MRRVLIICSVFPPQSDVGGLRPAMMAKYLPEFGWQPVILTRDYGRDHACRDEKMHLAGMPPADSVLRVEVSAAQERQYMMSRGLKGKWRDFYEVERAHPPGGYDRMYEEAKLRLTDRSFDAIWATAPGYAPIRLGRDFAQELRIPWIADFRDIPEQERGMPRSWRGHLLVQRTIRRRRQLVSTAALITSVSPYHCGLLQRKLGKRCEVIYNGYDAEVFGPQQPRRTSKFRIVYIGRILNRWYQDPSLLFSALDALIAAGQLDPEMLEVAFYGTDGDILASIVAPYRSARWVRTYARIPYKEVPEALGRATILLLLTNRGRKGILTTKLFEYLAVHRPILCVSAARDEDIPVLLRAVNSGSGACSVDEAKQFLLTAYRQWLKSGVVPVASDEDAIVRCTRRAQAKRLAELLDEVLVASDAGKGTESPCGHGKVHSVAVRS